MDYFASYSNGIDLRDEMAKIIHGSADLVGQGRTTILRRLTDTTCPACWDKTSGGSSRPNCPYCKGEGYQFYETIETVVIFRGVAPVYKPGVLATGQYPQAGMGYTDTNRATAYLEVLRPDGTETYPNYERYTKIEASAYDKLYETKVDTEGVSIIDSAGQYIRSAKWKVLSVVPTHGDHGRVEFFELGLEKENV